MAEAWLYDGRSAVRRQVAIEPIGDGLSIDGGDMVTRDLLLHAESRSEAEIYCRRDIEGWRLGVAKPIPDAVLAVLPPKREYGAWVDRIGLPKALLAGGIASALLIMVGYAAPGWVAPLVPPSWEDQFGDTLVGDFGGKFCITPAGQQALDALSAKLTKRPGELNVRVVDLPMVNAAALPGGNIVLFNGLLREAEGPDEIAGVLGHEIAHIQRRHVTEAMVRHFGLGMIVTALGGNMGANVNTLLVAGYSRAAETEADEGAVAALRQADISPLPTAEFFARMARDEGKLGRLSTNLEYLSTHPLSDGRRKQFQESVIEERTYRPALSHAQWTALSNICGTPDAEG